MPCDTKDELVLLIPPGKYLSLNSLTGGAKKDTFIFFVLVVVEGLVEEEGLYSIFVAGSRLNLADVSVWKEGSLVLRFV